MKTKD